MLLVLSSLLKSGTPGIKEWAAANVAAFVALLLFAGRGVAPDFLSIEVANSLLAGALALVYVGMRRFFALNVPFRLLGSGLGMMMAGVAYFHYIVNSVDSRIVIVSLFHGTVSLAIGWTIFTADKSLRRRYAFFLTYCVAFLFSFGHFVRGTVYASGFDALTFALHASGWNLVFLSIGTLVLPLYGMGAVMMAHDRMMAKARNEADHDFLTAVWSRRAFFDMAERELSRSRRTGRPLSLMVFDVDHFKNLNDSFGHAAGDAVLVAIARRAAEEIRIMDCLGRIGGEEFAVLLPEVDEVSALAIAERLRRALNDQVYPDLKKPGPGDPVSVSVSIGVATADCEETLSELLNRADKALYQAKAEGRNRVVRATSLAA